MSGSDIAQLVAVLAWPVVVGGFFVYAIIDLEVQKRKIKRTLES